MLVGRVVASAILTLRAKASLLRGVTPAPASRPACDTRNMPASALATNHIQLEVRREFLTLKSVAVAITIKMFSKKTAWCIRR